MIEKYGEIADPIMNPASGHTIQRPEANLLKFSLSTIACYWQVTGHETATVEPDRKIGSFQFIFQFCPQSAVQAFDKIEADDARNRQPRRTDGPPDHREREKV
jgi:hypothetical protein